MYLLLIEISLNKVTKKIIFFFQKMSRLINLLILLIKLHGIKGGENLDKVLFIFN